MWCETEYNPLHPQLVEDTQLREADRILWHLGQVEKSFKLEKHKVARDLLLNQALEGGAGFLEAVQHFKEDPAVLTLFKREATLLLEGHVSRSKYNSCLGLVAARLMFW